MHKVLLTVLTLVLVSTLGFAEMKLKLKSDFFSETNSSIISNNLESNLNLNLPSEIVAPVNMMELVKGLMLLGVLGDVSFPMGNDSGFKHIAGTAWSGHLEFSYMVSPAFRLAFRGGYINFGKQTEEGTGYSYEDTYSQIPLLIGGYYMIPTGSGFKPYVGLSIGVFFETYAVNWTEDFGFGEPFTLDDSFTATGFGVVPAIGTYYIAGKVLVQFAVEYTYIFTDGPTATYDYSYYPLGKTNGVAQDETTYEEPTDKASYFSVLLGVSFPVGK